MAGVLVEHLQIPCLYLGEGPQWEPERQALVVVDVFGKALRKFFVKTGRQQVLYIDDGSEAKTLTAVIPVEGTDDLYLVTLGNKICLVQWRASDPEEHRVGVRVLKEVGDTHFSEAKCDPRGRLWVGTKGRRDESLEVPQTFGGGLYRLDHDLTLKKLTDEVSYSNGFAWCLYRKTFYCIDSEAVSVEAYNYDDATGHISNRRTVLTYESAGLGGDIPDGVTNDVDGNLWIANFRGSKVICLDPVAGRVSRQVDLPSKNVTSVCWGGPNYSTLFVTSGKMHLNLDDLEFSPLAGGTFAITGLGTRGCPAPSFRSSVDLRKYL